LHVQVKLPGVFAQVAFAPQCATPVQHSSSSLQTPPMFENPGAHSRCPSKHAPFSAPLTQVSPAEQAPTEQSSP
jgi:hypothetical protein